MSGVARKAFHGKSPPKDSHSAVVTRAIFSDGVWGGIGGDDQRRSVDSEENVLGVNS